MTKTKMKINGKTLVYLVIDMQEGFTREGALANPRATQLIRPMADLLQKEKNNGAVILATQDTHTPDDEEFKMFPPHCVAGTLEHQLVRELWGLPDKIFQKRRFSGFFETQLEEFLRRLGGPQHVLVRMLGVCTDICVLYTTEELRNRGYEVEVLVDHTDTFDIPGHPGDETKAWVLSHMQSVLGAKIVRG